MSEDIIDHGHGISELFINDATSAILREIDAGSEIFDETKTHPVKLPGKLNRYRGYVPWGNDNQLPYKILEKIKKDEVMSQNKLFNVLTCYASGIRIRRENEEKITDKEILEFFKYNRMPRFFLEQATDMKYYFFSVAVIILSKDGKKIVKIRHKDAEYCRFETCNPKNGKIENLFYADWEGNIPKEDEIEVIPVLDAWDPIGDLEIRMGKIPGADGKIGKPTNDRKFAIINTFPTTGNKYYPFAYYWSVFMSGWYDIKQMIPAGKKAKFRNHTGIKYQVEVHRDYWENICREEKITDPEKKSELVKKEKENINPHCRPSSHKFL